MDKRNEKQEPLRRFITPQQLGFLTFFILFWVLVIHYTVQQGLQPNEYCIDSDPDGAQTIRYGESCVEDE